jgi:hypothetical protein
MDWEVKLWAAFEIDMGGAKRRYIVVRLLFWEAARSHSPMYQDMYELQYFF